MKFTIERERLGRMILQACGPLKSKQARKLTLQLSACAARVFVTGPAAVAGYEALVFSDGQCQLPAWRFLEIIKSYANKTNLTIAVDERGICIERYRFAVQSFSRQTTPPAHFQVFPVTDLYVLGKPTTP